MKKLQIAIAAVLCAVVLAACNTTQQTTTYNALASIENTADASYNAYVQQVIKGTIRTNSLPAVSKAYNDLHAAIGLAATLDQSGTNVLVSANLTAELTSLVNLIATATQH